MPNHVDGVLLHAMSGTDLSRVRTALNGLRILAASSPHPIQLNRQSAPHGYLGNVLVPTHRQVHIPASPVRMNAPSCLARLHRQNSQQGTTSFPAISQSLLPAPAILTPHNTHFRPTL